MQVNKVFIY